MSNRFVRSSKFRHVFGTPNKKDKCYDNIRLSKSPYESNMCDVNGKFVAVVMESQGGGAFMVAPLEKTGRFDINYPKLCAHKGLVLDIQWNPFDDNEIASCSEDCTIMLWNIPDGGLTENVTEAAKTLNGHKRKVCQLSWHPCAADILASLGHDNDIFIWNTQTAEVCFRLEHNDQVFSMSWNYDGSRMATTCKDKQVRVFDPRQQKVVNEGIGHVGNKPSRVVFCGEHNQLFTTGFSRSSERQYGLWDCGDLSNALVFEEMDTGSGVMFPFYDPGTAMVYIVGKGDTAIKYFEVKDNNVFFLSLYQSTSSQRGAARMPKRHLDYMQCETMRLYKLCPPYLVEPITFKVPRKSEMFQDDLFPPCAAGISSLSADEWVSGITKGPVLVTFTPEGLGETSTGVACKPITTSSMRTLVKQTSHGSTSSGGSGTRPRSTSPEQQPSATTGESDAQLAKENQRLRTELQRVSDENRLLTHLVKNKDDTIKRIRDLVKD